MSLYGRTSAELREMCLRWYLEPMARRLFAAHEDVQSVVLAVAQYWADNASDEVHVWLWPSRQRDPAWGAPVPRAHERRDWQIEAVREAHRALFGSSRGPVTGTARAITAFASFCKEGCTQEGDAAESFSPYAIARRGKVDGDGIQRVDIEVTGTMLRPAAENQWAVGYEAPRYQDEAPVVASVPFTPVPPDLLPDVLAALDGAGDWQSVVIELLRAAETAVNEPSDASRWRLRAALDTVRYLAQSVGIASPEGAPPDDETA